METYKTLKAVSSSLRDEVTKLTAIGIDITREIEIIEDLMLNIILKLVSHQTKDT